MRRAHDSTTPGRVSKEQEQTEEETVHLKPNPPVIWTLTSLMRVCFAKVVLDCTICASRARIYAHQQSNQQPSVGACDKCARVCMCVSLPKPCLCTWALLVGAAL